MNETENIVKLERDPMAFVRLACKDNASAIDFCTNVHCWFHHIDDLIDEKHAMEPAAWRSLMVKTFAEGIVVLSHPFYLANLPALRMTVLQVSQLFALAAQWELATETWRRDWADVQRHAGGQLFCAVAMICGGWQHAQDMLRIIAEDSAAEPQKPV